MTTSAKTSDGAKYRAIIDAAEKRLSKQVKASEAQDGDDAAQDEFSDPLMATNAIARHRSFLPFVEAGLLPASIAIRMAVEGNSALAQVDE
jgi:hypothetical protein